MTNRSYTQIGFIAVLAACLSACTSEEERALQAGAEIYQNTCKVCHAQGINGAPILGNKKMWGKRAEQGKEVLVQHAMEGYGLMPAKGGNESLSQEHISHVVTYMLSELK